MPLTKTRDDNLRKNCDFSFSGLKTNIKTLLGKVVVKTNTEEQNAQIRYDVAASFQQVAIKHLCIRVERGITWFQSKNFKQLVIAGGVAANKLLRSSMDELCTKYDIQCVYPPIKYCMDNGVMVAWNGVERFKRGL